MDKEILISGGIALAAILMGKKKKPDIQPATTGGIINKTEHIISPDDIFEPKDMVEPEIISPQYTKTGLHLLAKEEERIASILKQIPGTPNTSLDWVPNPIPIPGSMRDTHYIHGYTDFSGNVLTDAPQGEDTEKDAIVGDTPLGRSIARTLGHNIVGTITTIGSMMLPMFSKTINNMGNKAVGFITNATSGGGGGGGHGGGPGYGGSGLGGR